MLKGPLKQAFKANDMTCKVVYCHNRTLSFEKKVETHKAPK